jgi:O-antigen/teichoic acid export membrane protein
LFVPIAVTQLGVVDYGIYNLMLQGAMLLRLVALQGFAQVLVRDYAVLAPQYGESELYAAGFCFAAAILMLITLVLVPFATELAHLFGLSAGQVWILVTMAGALSIFGTKQVFLYCRNLNAYTMWDAAQVLATILSLVIIGGIFPAPEGYGVAYTLITLIVASVMFRLPRTPSLPLTTMRKLASEVRRYGFPLMIGEALGWVVSVADRFQIAAILGPEQTGIYAAAYQLFVAPMTLLGFAVAVVVQPAAFASDATAFRARMEQAATLLTGVSVLCLSTVVLCGKEGFGIFFRHQASVSMILIVLLTLTGIANSFFQLELIAGKYVRRAWIILATQAGAAAVILAGNWMLLSNAGIVAAAGTSFAAYVLMIAVLRVSSKQEKHFSYFSLRAGRAGLSSLHLHIARAAKKS